MARSKNQKGPKDERKDDLSLNPSNVGNKLLELKQRESSRVPLKIDSKTVVLVDPENCTEYYRQKFLKRMNSYGK